MDVHAMRDVKRILGGQRLRDCAELELGHEDIGARRMQRVAMQPAFETRSFRVQPEVECAGNDRGLTPKSRVRDRQKSPRPPPDEIQICRNELAGACRDTDLESEVLENSQILRVKINALENAAVVCAAEEAGSGHPDRSYERTASAEMRSNAVATSLSTVMPSSS